MVDQSTLVEEELDQIGIIGVTRSQSESRGLLRGNNAVDLSSVLQQKLHHIEIAMLRGHMQGVLVILGAGKEVGLGSLLEKFLTVCNGIVQGGLEETQIRLIRDLVLLQQVLRIVLHAAGLDCVRI